MTLLERVLNKVVEGARGPDKNRAASQVLEEIPRTIFLGYVSKALEEILNERATK